MAMPFRFKAGGGVMAPNTEPHHHRSTTKQSHKPFKSRHATKSLIKEIAKGKLDKIQKGSRKTTNQQVMSKFDRRNQARQIRQTKHTENVKASSIFSGQNRAPRIVAVVPLCEDVDVSRAIGRLNLAVGAEQVQDGHGRVRVERFKQTLLYIPLEGGQIAAMDACRAADFVIFLLSSVQEVDEQAEMVLRIIEGQGVSNVLTMVQDLNHALPPKKHSQILSSLKSYITRFFPNQEKILSLDSEQECVNAVRSLCTTTPKGIKWREDRSWMLVEDMQWPEKTDGVDGAGEVIVTGVIRGRGLKADRLVQVGDWGHFQIDKVTDATQPLPRKRKANEMAIDQESQTEAILQKPGAEQEDPSELAPYEATMDDVDATSLSESPAEKRGVLLDDHHYFSDDDTHLPEGPKKLPRGTSNYQAAWFLGDMSDDGSDYDDEVDADGDYSMESPALPADGTEGLDQNVPRDPTEAAMSEYPQSEMFVDPSPDDEAAQIAEYRANRKDEAKEDLEFPDEIELPPNVIARERLARYRGLKSLKTSRWETSEDRGHEPADWNRLLQIPDYKRAKKQAENDALAGGVPPGTRVHIHLRDVPLSLQASTTPVAIFSLLRHEQKRTVVNVSITLGSDNPAPLRSKTELIVQCGARRFKINPLFSHSGNTPNNVHKFLRYLHPGQTAIASFVAPVTWGSVPVLFFQTADYVNAPFDLVGKGTSLPASTSRIIAKRVILTGHPYKIHKKLVTVRYMFFNVEDVAWFKALQLWTKRGRSGFIKESLGTHGYFKATFDGKINPQDAVGQQAPTPSQNPSSPPPTQRRTHEGPSVVTTTSPVELRPLRHQLNRDGVETSPPSPRQHRRAARAERELRKLEQGEKMKFSHSIQFNAVPDWSSHYISYSNLKKLIYQLEKSIHQSSGAPHDGESSPLLQSDDPDTTFRQALDHELEKICSFYQVKELEIYGELENLQKDEQSYDAEAHGLDLEQLETQGGGDKTGRPRRNSVFSKFGFGSRPRRTSTMSVNSTTIDEADEDGDSSADETSAMNKGRNGAPVDRRKTYDAGAGHNIDDMRSSRELPSRQRRASQAFDDYSEQAFSTLFASGMTLKKRTISLYVSLCELKSFIQLNRTGFSKVLKKYDKTLDRDLKNDYIKDRVMPAYPFKDETMKHLDANIASTEKAYAEVITKGDIGEAKRELRLHLREHVVWERNTVWREMIGIERKAQAANLGLRRTLLGGDDDPNNARLQGDQEVLSSTREVRTPLGRYRCPTWLFSSTFFTLIVILAIFVVLLVVPIMEQPEQQNCLAMLALVSMMWATEVIPLFVTAMLVPFLAVVLQVVRSDAKPHHRLDPSSATKYIFAAMWTPVIMLLLGGFTIAAALSKFHIAKMMATFVLSKAGTRPRTVLITNMFVAMILSMWISNVAAPVLCFSIIQPLLRNLPSDANFSKALILGIALAANIGGAASPIASPQNIIALHNMHPEPSWGIWFFIALPVCVISVLLIWLLLLVTFQPGKDTTIIPIRPMKDRFTGVQWFISCVTIITIVLWCVTHQLEGVFGDMGVVAIIPIVLFFGTGILTKEDFNNFLWTIIILAAGGLSLGKAVESSGLLHTIAGKVTSGVEGMSLYRVLVVFAALILVIATFISHTVAALILLPLVQQVGAGMSEPHPNLLVMGSALMCSAAMGLPTSGFPNMTAIMMEDSQTGQRYLRVYHFLSRGIPSSIIVSVVVITLGYGLLRAAGL